MTFVEALQSATGSFTPVIDDTYTISEYIAFDMSAKNGELGAIDQSDPETFQCLLDDFLLRSDKKIAYGGYNEKRSLYDGNDKFGSDRRNIHLGIDFWASAGTSVLVPLDGKVHSFQNNAAFGDYGPTIILQHQVFNYTFYTLYGHLSIASLDELYMGKFFQKGERIAALGSPDENVGYAPHLHFQIIKDLQGKTGDYPGVCNEKDSARYLENCPDPALLLKLP